MHLDVTFDLRATRQALALAQLQFAEKTNFADVRGRDLAFYDLHPTLPTYPHAAARRSQIDASLDGGFQQSGAGWRVYPLADRLKINLKITEG